MKTLRALASLNPYFWRYRKHLFWGIVVVAFSNLFTIAQGPYVRLAVDATRQYMVAHSDQALSDVWFYSAMILVVSVAGGIFLFLARQTLIVMSHWIVNDLRNDIFVQLQNLSLSFYRRNKTGDLMARITEDISRVRMYLGPGVMYNLNTGVRMLIILPLMLMVNWELTLYALIPLPILSIAIYNVESFVNDRSDKIQSQLSNLTSFTQEIFSGIRLVKAYVREDDINRKMHEESERYKKRSLSLVKMESLFTPMVLALMGLSNILVVWVGGRQVIEGKITYGNIAEFLIYVNMMTWPIISLGWVTTLIQRAAASQTRIDQLMNETPSIRFPEKGSEPAYTDLEFRDVYFQYPETGIEVLKGVSFRLRPGEKLGILGATGSGKTTLCHLIPRLMDPDSGSILLGGKDLKSYERETLRQAIGYCPQDVFLFSDTLKENIGFGVQNPQQPEIEKAAKDASVYQNIMDFPQQFETMIGERGVTLSGGQKQRVAIARALMRKPAILILDDSLSAVDTRTEEDILSRLREARKQAEGMSVVMVSHRISTLQDSDRILVLSQGKISESGTHAELLALGGYYASVYAKQQMEKEMEGI